METENRDDIAMEVDHRLDELFGGENDPLEESFDASDGKAADPLQALRTIVLSMDWQIPDDVLSRFLKEIKGLREIWSNERVNLLFLQLLEALGKYIHSRKTEAHPEAVPLLHSSFSDLEYVLSEGDMTETARKEVLMRDVKAFKQLKEKIGRPKTPEPTTEPEAAAPAETEEEPAAPPPPEMVAEAAELEPVFEPEKPAINFEAEAEESASKESEHPEYAMNFETESGASEAAAPSPAQPGASEMTPHEAFAFALEEIKKTIKAEFEALRAEIKLWRQGG